jgi:transcriptional regulator with XRE-family HTH domain
MARLGRAHRALRHRLGQTQQDVADAAGLTRAKISRLENARLDLLSVVDVDRSFAAMGARVVVIAQWNGAALDRLLDEGHALLTGLTSAYLRARGWQVELEVSFSEYGERGSIDILAWHPVEKVLLVIEIKSEMGALEGLLRPLDVKVRLAPKIARQRFGWVSPLVVGRLDVLPNNMTARRTVARHSNALDLALPARTRAVRRWLDKPIGPLSGLWFVSSASPTSVKRNPSSIRRVRKPQIERGVMPLEPESVPTA